MNSLLDALDFLFGCHRNNETRIFGKYSGAALCCTMSVVLWGTLLYAASTSTSEIRAGGKVHVTGLILSRNSDTVRIEDKKSGQVVVVNITDNTKIEHKSGGLPFFRHTHLDVTAMVPGLTITAEGVGDSKGRLEAQKISCSPDEFAVEVAEQQEVMHIMWLSSLPF